MAQGSNSKIQVRKLNLADNAQAHSVGVLERLPQLIEELDAAIMVIGREDGRFKYFNNAICRDLGKTRSEVRGKHYRQIFRPEFILVYDRLLNECADGCDHSTIFYWPEVNQWEKVSARVIVWNNEPCVLLAICFISEIARAEYRFENIAYFDNLLKIPNGEKLEEDINDIANFETVALLVIAFERFEEINNLYGWEKGNNLLMQIRDWLLISESRRAQIYRIHKGFAVLGRVVTMEEAEERAQEILTRFEQPWALTAGDNPISVFCPIKFGIVYGRYVRNEMRNLLLRTTLLEPGEKGYVIYDEEADSRVKRTMKLRDWLINSVRKGMEGFEVHYQPVANAKTKKWVALEALCRWTAPNGESIPPSEFIDIAEQLGLVRQIDAWVRRTAMHQCVHLGLDEKEFALDINFSPTYKINEKFLRELQISLMETGFPAEKLNIEITESTKMNFDEDTISGLNNLKKMGVQLCLDDFGTGNSSFENLINIPADILKTDRMFIDGIENDEYRQLLLISLIDLTRHLDMGIIAEGVETEEQAFLMDEYGVDFIQGYYFSRPLSFTQLAKEVHRFEN